MAKPIRKGRGGGLARNPKAQPSKTLSEATGGAVCVTATERPNRFRGFLLAITDYEGGGAAAEQSSPSVKRNRKDGGVAHGEKNFRSLQNPFRGTCLLRREKSNGPSRGGLRKSGNLESELWGEDLRLVKCP